MTTEIPEDETYDKVDSIEIDPIPGGDEGLYEVIGIINPGSANEAVVCAGDVDAVLINGTVSPVVADDATREAPPLILDEIAEETNLMVSFKAGSIADIWIGDNLGD